MLALTTLSLLAAVAAYRPGIPPQIFDEYMCIFHRFNIGGKEYSWDLAKLAANAGSEYVAWKDGCNPNVPGSGDSTQCPSYQPNSYEDIVFNVCGTVSTAVAEMVCCDSISPCVDPTNPQPTECRQKPAPLPHSHGVAVQFIEKNPPLAGYTCVDMDSCDTATNFDPNTGRQCGIGPDMTQISIGSLNYPANTAPNTNFPNGGFPDAAFSNPGREGVCQSNPNRNYCKTTGTKCTGQAEVLAYYDGSAPTFSLADEANPNGGINLTYAGALPYINFDQQTDRCPAIDPSTGYQVQRYVNIFIGCDKNAKTLTVDKYTERGQCQYYIEARAAAACGVTGDPFVDCSGGKCYFGKDMAGLFFGTVLLIVPFCYVVWKYCDYRGWLEPVKRFIPDVSPYLPDWLSGRGGVYGGGSYKFVSSASSGATATTSGAAISSSAYGST